MIRILLAGCNTVPPKNDGLIYGKDFHYVPATEEARIYLWMHFPVGH